MTLPADLSDAMVMASWFPADVKLPDTEHGPGPSFRRCRVYITTHDLVVFTKPLQPELIAAVDFTRTPAPPELTWPANDLDVHTEAGIVVIHPTGGCGCGHPLKRWQPEWAGRRTPWRTP